MARYLTGNTAPSPEAVLSAATPYAPELPASVGPLLGAETGLGRIARTLAGEEQQAIANQFRQQQFAMQQQLFRQRAAEREQKLALHKQAVKQTNELVRQLATLDPHSMKDEDILQRGMEAMRQFYTFAPNFRDERTQRAMLARMQQTGVLQRYMTLRQLQKARALHPQADVFGRQMRTGAMKLWQQHETAQAQVGALSTQLEQLVQQRDALPADDLARMDYEREIARTRDALAKAQAQSMGAVNTLLGWHADPQFRGYLPGFVTQRLEHLLQLEKQRQEQAQREAEARQARQAQLLRLGTPQPKRFFYDSQAGVVRYVMPDGSVAELAPDEYDALKQRFTNLRKRERLAPWQPEVPTVLGIPAR